MRCRRLRIFAASAKKYETILEKLKNPAAPSHYESYGSRQGRTIDPNMAISRAFKGSYRVFIDYATKKGYKTIADLKGISLDEIRSVNWPGNAIYKSFLRKLERYGVRPVDYRGKLDIDRHGMGILTDDVKLNKAYQNAKVANLREFLQLGEEGRLAIKNYGEISENLLRDLLLDHEIDPEQFENTRGSRFPERDMKLKPDDILGRMKTLLSQREYMILVHRGIKKQTLESVGSELNLTRERIRQIEKRPSCAQTSIWGRSSSSSPIASMRRWRRPAVAIRSRACAVSSTQKKIASA